MVLMGYPNHPGRRLVIVELPAAFETASQPVEAISVREAGSCRHGLEDEYCEKCFWGGSRSLGCLAVDQ